MGKSNPTALRVLRKTFPKSDGWEVRGIGKSSRAAELWHHGYCCGQIHHCPSTDRWVANVGPFPPQADAIVYDSPKAAVLAHVSLLPDGDTDPHLATKRRDTLAALQA